MLLCWNWTPISRIDYDFSFPAIRAALIHPSIHPSSIPFSLPAERPSDGNGIISNTLAQFTPCFDRSRNSENPQGVEHCSCRQLGSFHQKWTRPKLSCFSSPPSRFIISCFPISIMDDFMNPSSPLWLLAYIRSRRWRSLFFSFFSSSGCEVCICMYMYVRSCTCMYYICMFVPSSNEYDDQVLTIDNTYIHALGAHGRLAKRVSRRFQMF